MIRALNLLTVLALAVTTPVVGSAQSLGDVARKEEARRKATKTGKVYTNDTIRGGERPAPTPAPADAAAGSQAQSGEKPKPAPAADDRKKQEEYWRGRVAEARNGLERAKMFQEALQTRINSLSNDFASRDDPAQRSQIASNRQKALAELDRVTKDIAGFQKQIADIEEEGRKAGVPPGWLR